MEALEGGMEVEGEEEEEEKRREMKAEERRRRERALDCWALGLSVVSAMVQSMEGEGGEFGGGRSAGKAQRPLQLGVPGVGAAGAGAGKEGEDEKREIAGLLEWAQATSPSTAGGGRMRGASLVTDSSPSGRIMKLSSTQWSSVVEFVSQEASLLLSSLALPHWSARQSTGMSSGSAGGPWPADRQSWQGPFAYQPSAVMTYQLTAPERGPLHTSFRAMHRTNQVLTFIGTFMEAHRRQEPGWDGSMARDFPTPRSWFQEVAQSVGLAAVKLVVFLASEGQASGAGVGDSWGGGGSSWDFGNAAKTGSTGNVPVRVVCDFDTPLLHHHHLISSSTEHLNDHAAGGTVEAAGEHAGDGPYS